MFWVNTLRLMKFPSIVNFLGIVNENGYDSAPYSNVGFLPTHPSNSPAPDGCPTIQLISDTT